MDSKTKNQSSENVTSGTNRRPKATSPASVSSDRGMTSSIPRLRVPSLDPAARDNSTDRRRSEDDPKSDSALLKPLQHRKDNSVSPSRTKTKIARPVQQKVGSPVVGDASPVVNSPVKPENPKPKDPKDEERKSATQITQRGISPGGGVLYITENMLQKITQVEYFHRVTELNLCLRNSKKIKFIEKLDGLYNLRRLILSHNIIEKISGLEKLTKLEYLDLSHNQVTLVGDNLEHLALLEQLDLSFNKIAGLSKNFGKNLHSLKILRLDNNDFKAFKSFQALENLTNLGSLKLENNPFCATTEYWESLVVYKVPTLSELDGKELTSSDHKEAHERFGKMETDRLWAALEKTSNDLVTEKALEKELRDQNEKLATQNKQLSQWKTENEQKLAEFQRETENNNDLLVQKTKEMNKLLDKNYELEQELAFFKIDKKFGQQGTINDLTAPDHSDMSDDMPYIGKAAGFKPKARPVTLHPEDETDGKVKPDKSLNKNREMQPEKNQEDPNQHARLKTMEDKFALAEKRLDDLHNNLAAIESNAQNPEYFRNKDPPAFVENLSPYYLPGPQTGYQGFREHGGEKPPVPLGRLSRLPASTYTLKRGNELYPDESFDDQTHPQNQELPNSSMSSSKPRQPKNRPTVTFKDEDDVSSNRNQSEQKPLLDDAISKYQNLQSELDEMLRMVRQETATVIGLEKQLNIHPSNVTDGYPGNFDALNYSDESSFSFDEPSVYPQTAVYGEAPTRNSRTPGNPQKMKKIKSGLYRPHTEHVNLQTANIRQIGNRRNIEKINDNSEFKNELAEMTEAICMYMQKLRSDIEKLKSVNNDLQNNLAEIKIKEAKTSETLEEMKYYQHRLENFLLQMKDVFHEHDLLEVENQRLENELGKYPSLQDIERWRMDSVNLVGYKNETAKQEKVISKLRAEIKQNKEKESSLLQNLGDCKKSEQKLLTEYLHVKNLLTQSEQNFEDTSKELIKVRENFNSYVDRALKPEHLLRHINTLTRNLDQAVNPEPLEFISSNDASFDYFSVFRESLVSKVSFFNNECMKLVSDNEKLKTEFDVAQKELKKANENLEKVKVEHSQVREKDKRTIEHKIEQWKNEVSRVKNKAEIDKVTNSSVVDRITQERDHLYEQIDKLEKELIQSECSLEEAKNSLESERHQAEVLREKMMKKEMTSRSEIENAKNEIREILSEKEDAANNLSTAMNLHNLEMSQLKKENEKLVRSLSDLQKACEVMKTDVMKAKTKEEKLEDEKEDLLDRCEELERDLQNCHYISSLKINQSKQSFDAEMARILGVISAQENNIAALNQDLCVERTENDKNQEVIGSLNAKLQKEINANSELNEKVEHLNEKLASKDKMMTSISHGMNTMEELDDEITTKKHHIENLQSEEKKILDKMEKIKRNWAQFRDIVAQNSVSADLLQFLEEKTSPILFLNDAKKLVEQWEQKRIEIEDLEQLLAIENETYEHLREKNEILKTDVDASRKERRKINEKIDLMKQLVEVSKMQTFNDAILDTL